MEQRKHPHDLPLYRPETGLNGLVTTSPYKINLTVGRTPGTDDPAAVMAGV